MIVGGKGMSSIETENVRFRNVKGEKTEIPYLIKIGEVGFLEYLQAFLTSLGGKKKLKCLFRMKVKVNPRLLPIKTHFFLNFAGLSPIIPFLPVIAKQLGFDEVTSPLCLNTKRFFRRISSQFTELGELKNLPFQLFFRSSILPHEVIHPFMWISLKIQCFGILDIFNYEGNVGDFRHVAVLEVP